MNDFSVTVVIPTYNRAQRMIHAIDSVLTQTRAVDEIIVVDDGSTDNTRQIITDKYPEIIYLFQPHNGVSSARNTGIRAAACDWICLLDSDDGWHANKLERQVSALSNNPDYRVCHTDETWYRNGRVLNQSKKHAKKGGRIFQHCLPLCAISPSSVMIHKHVFAEAGRFDERLPACEDYDMWLRITARFPVLYLDEALTDKHGGHSDQLSKQHWGLDRFRIAALDKIISIDILNRDDRDAAVNMLVKKIHIFLNGANKRGKNEYCAKFEKLLKHYA